MFVNADQQANKIVMQSCVIMTHAYTRLFSSINSLKQQIADKVGSPTGTALDLY
jgi:hypothetical protein